MFDLLLDPSDPMIESDTGAILASTPGLAPAHPALTIDTMAKLLLWLIPLTFCLVQMPAAPSHDLSQQVCSNFNHHFHRTAIDALIF